MKNFTITAPTEIRFGAGRISDAAGLAAGFGQTVCLVTRKNPDGIEALQQDLEQAGLQSIIMTVDGEPTTASVEILYQQARDAGCDCVMSLGGGSVMDAGKVIAAFLTNDGDLLDYLEGVGKGQPLLHRSAPHIAIPTTSGTGAEVTRNAVLGVEAHRVKVSMRSPLMLPHVAIVDPELTYGLPPEQTAASGLDALVQVFEAYVTPFANPYTDGLCREGLIRAGRSMRRVVENGQDAAARADLAIAATFSGLALAHAKLGAVHGIAGPLGGMYKAPHGAVCARLLPPVIRITIQALKARGNSDAVMERFQQACRWVTGHPTATVDDGADWLEALCQDLAIPPLCTWGVDECERDDLIQKSMSSSSMKGNPIVLTEDELRTILEQAQ